MLRTVGRWWAGLWVRSGSGEIIHGADGEWRSFLARVHSTKVAKSSQGPSLDDSALLAVFKLAS